MKRGEKPRHFRRFSFLTWVLVFLITFSLVSLVFLVIFSLSPENERIRNLFSHLRLSEERKVLTGRQIEGGSMGVQALTLSLIPSRTSCVAPCAVFFDATGTTSTITNRPFHELDYSWNFGDSASGTWSVDGKSKNTAKGAVAAHVFENPGAYTVSLSVKDTDGAVETSQVTFNIQNPDIVFSGNNTICFSQAGDFTGCPSGAQQITTTSFSSVMSYVAAGRRLLLRRGETWSTSSGYLINNLGPGILGAFGTGAKPKIELTASNRLVTLSACTSPQLEDWRFMDLEIYRVGTGSAITFQNGGMSKKLLFLRIDAHDIVAHVTMDHSPGNYCNNQTCGGNATCLGPHRSHEEIAIVENRVYNIYGGNAVYLGTERSMVMGNTLSVNPENTIPSEHVLRTPMIDKGVIQHNDLRGEGDTVRHVLKLHGPDPALDDYYQWGLGLETGRRTQYAVVSDNVFESRVSGGNVVISPSDSESNEAIAEVVFERNYLISTSPTMWRQLWINARNVTVRNNVFDLSNGIQGGGTKTAVSINTRGIEPPPRDIHVYDNTAYNPEINHFYFAYLDGTDAGTIVRNNLIYSPNSAPNGWTVSAVEGAGPGLIQSNNVDASAQSAGNIFVDTALDSTDDYALVDSAYTQANLINRGFDVPVFEDYFGALRSDGLQDIGAFEFVQLTADSTPPSIPASLQASTSASQIDLSWSASSDPESGISRYNVYRNNALVGQPILISYSDTGLTPGTSYTYEVSAVNGASLESGRSVGVSATTLSASCADGDGDGYNNTLGCGVVDCNDTSPGINPSASEACDGIDNNCINGIDEGCSSSPGTPAGPGGGGPGSEGSTTPPKTIRLTYQQLQEGVRVELLRGDKVEAVYGDGKVHAFSVESVSSSALVLKVGAITRNLSLGSPEVFNLDGDNVNELIVRYNSYTNGRAVVYFKEERAVVEEGPRVGEEEQVPEVGEEERPFEEIVKKNIWVIASVIIVLAGFVGIISWLVWRHQRHEVQKIASQFQEQFEK